MNWFTVRFRSLHESDLILWDWELATFLVVMVSAVQCISLDKVKVYGMASLCLCSVVSYIMDILLFTGEAGI